MIAALLSDFVPWLVGIGGVIAVAFGWGWKRQRDGVNAERERQRKADLATVRRRDNLRTEIQTDDDPVLIDRLADGR